MQELSKRTIMRLNRLLETRVKELDREIRRRNPDLAVMSWGFIKLAQHRPNF